MTDPLAELIRNGTLVPVQVFGGPDTCPKCGTDVPWAYGLCDRFSRYSPGGSDCNRSEFFLLRPNDYSWAGAVLPDLNEVRAAIKEVREDDYD
jgi:hypothetical protein